MDEVRIGAVPYLNARPLVAYLEQPGSATGVRVFYDTPAMLAAGLRLGHYRLALVSSYEALARPNLQFVPDISISTRGEVKSVRLFSKKPFEEIETLALDSGSLTSAHLAQILLAELYDAVPMVCNEEPNLHRMLERNDACVVIGDIGMWSDGTGLHVMDLGLAWTELTGLPFVWAAWIGEPGISPELVRLLQEAKRWGLHAVNVLAEQHAQEQGRDPAACRDYLGRIMDYDLTRAHLDGIELFQVLLLKHGIIEHLYPVTVAPVSGSRDVGPRTVEGIMRGSV
ncbi:MAG: menaquinone biosynthesis protein [Fimbriimonadia bacterium]|jgi:chorismate dehydratase